RATMPSPSNERLRARWSRIPLTSVRFGSSLISTGKNEVSHPPSPPTSAKTHGRAISMSAPMTSTTTTYSRTTTMKISEHTEMQDQLRTLGLWGLLENFEDIADEEWLPRVIEMEARSRHQRSRERRLTNAKLGTFKPAADFDWAWPKKIDREAFDELFKLKFVSDGVNVILLGPNGIGKTMLAKNLVHQAVVRGHTARFTTASDMLSDLAAQ